MSLPLHFKEFYAYMLAEYMRMRYWWSVNAKKERGRNATILT